MADGTSDPPPVRITLYCCQYGSDKVYQAAIEPSAGGYIVTYAFGRRGSTLQTGCKTAAPVGYAQAKRLYDQLVRSKTAKGYSPGAQGTPYHQTDREQRYTGIQPQLLNAITETQLGKYLADDDWWMQEKFDGRRLLIRKELDRVAAINRKGLSVALPDSIRAAVLTLGAGYCLLDGEAVGEVYQAFDLLSKDGQDLRTRAYASRYEQLTRLLDPALSKCLCYAESARDAGTKACLLHQLRLRQREGAVFKDSTAPYTSGRPAQGGSQLKLKFYATASCRVAAIHRGKRSVTMELIDAAQSVAVGNVTIPANLPVPQVGAVIEVRYLYAYRGGSLFQPVYLRQRDDLDAGACTLNQLKFKSEDEADES